MPISNPKPDLHNINAHTKIGENPLTFTQLIILKRKYGWTYDRQMDTGMANYCVAGYNKIRENDQTETQAVVGNKKIELPWQHNVSK